MNRKNLTAAVLAGLAGVAGIAGTAQAVNLNPDGTGQVLLYPYYTTNAGNQTLMSVVNTTDQAKAVKVRFLEGYNSREVLDFNMYMSREDVWVAAIVNGGDFTGDSSLDDTSWVLIPDTTCTVPYLYETNQIELADGSKAGLQQFLDLAFAGKANDGGPEGMARVGEGHIEVIEMGVIPDEDIVIGVDSKGKDITMNIAEAVTHVDGVPEDCDLLTELWTTAIDPSTGDVDLDESGLWIQDMDSDGQVTLGTARNSGGLFGGGAVLNAGDGTMYSYDAKAIQGFDSTDNGVHFMPGTIYPSLKSGNNTDAFVFFGVPQNQAVKVEYGNSVDAISAVFMHDYLMNEYYVGDDLNAGTEWVITFPTKNFYVDVPRMVAEGLIADHDADDEPVSTVPSGWSCAPEKDDDGVLTGDYVSCEPEVRMPFTELFGATDKAGDPLCEVVNITTWDREEATFEPDSPTGPTLPPVVSPSLPPSFDCTDFGNCPSFFQLCGEVNVLRFGERSVFGTPEIEGQTLLVSVEDEFDAGWGRINMTEDRGGDTRTDSEGLVGLPVTGFAAMRYENGYVQGENGTVQAFYGGLFGHKFSVRAVADPDG